MGGLTIRDRDGQDRIHTYTNSLEAFEQNYAKGYRVFEVDLILTRDDKLVARHSWSRAAFGALGQQYPGRVPSWAEFMRTPIRGSYTPLDMAGIAKIMREYPDVYIITDTKAIEAATIRTQFKSLLSALGADRYQLSKRLIIQVYTEGMYHYVRRMYPFPNFIYTLYMLRTTSDRAAVFAHAHGIRVIVCFEQKWTPELRARCRSLGLAVGIHTINAPSAARRVFGNGAWYVYSDALPSDPAQAAAASGSDLPQVASAPRIPGVW